MRQNKYSDLKIVQFPEKIQSFHDGVITAPIYVRIKPINRCNQDCHFCCYAQSWRKTSSETDEINHIVSDMHTDMNESDTMPTAKALELIDDLKEMGVRAVTFSGGGEPLLHKDIVTIMERVVEYGIDLSIITNGQLLRGDRAAVLAKAKWVRVSMDYTNAEQMILSRRVGEKAFTDTMENLKTFSALKGESCDLGINYIVHKANYEGLVPFATLLKESGVENVRFSPMWIPNFVEYHTPIKARVEEQLREAQSLVDERFSINSTYELNSSTKSIHRKYTKCLFMQTVPVVGADQVVYACHNKAYDKTGAIGHIRDKRFKELWFSDEAKHVFETLNPQKVCRHECANDNKNLIFHNLASMHADNFV
ncbi:MAG: radical SAM protein [Verrucomicrobium sp.]|nr:radical SAM protein [Verrucomicrobium sp.]